MRRARNKLLLAMLGMICMSYFAMQMASGAPVPSGEGAWWIVVSIVSFFASLAAAIFACVLTVEIFTDENP